MRQARIYAQALISATENASNEEELGARVERFIGVLRTRGHIQLLPRILNEYQRQMQRKKRSQAALLSVNDEGDIEKAKQAAAAYLTPQELEVLQTQTDETLGGGFVLETNDKRVDSSYKNMLLHMYRNLIIQ